MWNEMVLLLRRIFEGVLASLGQIWDSVANFPQLSALIVAFPYWGVPILEARGVVLHMIKIERPDCVVCEDVHEVAAEPFRETGT
jgi:hypothetical protein